MEDGEFVRLGWAGGAALKGDGEAFFLDDLFQSGGEFEEAGVIHQRERLEWGVAADAASAGAEAFRGVEDSEGGWW